MGEDAFEAGFAQDTPMIADFFASGHAADVVMAVLAAEGLWLARRGWSGAKIARVLGPAVLIVLGLRAALVGAEWYWVALPLAASFPLHVLDIAERRGLRSGGDGAD